MNARLPRPGNRLFLEFVYGCGPHPCKQCAYLSPARVRTMKFEALDAGLRTVTENKLLLPNTSSQPRSIIISGGGESALHPQFEKLLKRAKQEYPGVPVEIVWGLRGLEKESDVRTKFGELRDDDVFMVSLDSQHLEAKTELLIASGKLPAAARYDDARRNAALQRHIGQKVNWVLRRALKQGFKVEFNLTGNYAEQNAIRRLFVDPFLKPPYWNCLAADASNEEQGVRRESMYPAGSCLGGAIPGRVIILQDGSVTDRFPFTRVVGKRVSTK